MKVFKIRQSIAHFDQSNYLPAQDCVLQGLLSLPDPEHFPPFRSAFVLIRDLITVPPPQVFEQGSQVDQGPHTQSSGKSTNVILLSK